MSSNGKYDLKGISGLMEVSYTAHEPLICVRLNSYGHINAHWPKAFRVRDWTGGLDELCEVYVQVVGFLEGYVAELPNAPEACAEIKAMLALMKTFCSVVRDDRKELNSMMDKELNNSRRKEFRPLYGVRRYPPGGYGYECSNLVQFCFAVIDILQKTNAGARSANTYIDVCKKCGKQYVSHHRNKKYCPICARENKVESTRRSLTREKPEAEKLEDKIKTKLRNHLRACSYSKKKSANERLAEELKELFAKENDERKNQPEYVEWLNQCFAYFMPEGADYKGLRDFLMK